MNISTILQVVLVCLNATSSLAEFSIYSKGFVQTCKNFKPISSDGQKISIPASLSYTEQPLTLSAKPTKETCKKAVIHVSELIPSGNPKPQQLNASNNGSTTPSPILDTNSSQIFNASDPIPPENETISSINGTNSTLTAKIENLSSITPQRLSAVNERAKRIPDQQTQNFRTFRKAWAPVNETKFYPNGYIRYQNEYYRPEDYCISEISSTKVNVEICRVDCSDKNTLCLPKCCGIGETLIYWTFTCKPIGNDSQEPHWSPTIYNKPKTKPLSQKERDNLHIQYTQPFKNCTINPLAPGRLPYSDFVHRPKKLEDHDPGLPWYILKSGDIQRRLETRRWASLNFKEGTYCVDGFANWGYGGNGTHTGKEDHQTIIYCQDDTQLVKQEGSDGDNGLALYYAYAVILLLSSVFLLLTAVVHVVLYERQNIHGLAILSQAVSLFFMYVTQGLAYLLTPFLANKGSNICWTIGMLAHFFFLSTFSWLTVVNYDLWLTFRSMRPVSKMSKKMRRFRLYSLIGWGVPILAMTVFLSLEFSYADYMDDVITPDYGKKSCYVASHARNYYLCSILAVVIPINLLMILMTFKIFYDFRNGKGSWTSKSAASDRYSFRLFMKLFFVMGAIWLVELIICWFFQGEQPPWFIIVLNCAMPAQAIAFFLIFCCNRRTMNQLEEKYACFETIFGPVRNIFNIPKSFDDCQTNETSPNTPGGIRKGSLSVSLSGTMDRKFSTESVVSRFENVELESMHSTA